MRDLRIGIVLLQLAEFLFGFSNQGGSRIQQSQKQMRRREIAPRPRDLSGCGLIEDFEFGLGRGGGRRSELLSVPDRPDLPCIDLPARERRRRPTKARKQWTC